MKNYLDSKLSTIVSENFKAAEILEENNIDFCCGGDKTLNEACKEQNISSKDMNDQLEMIMTARDSETEFIKNLDPSELCDYITKRHHSFVRENIPVLKKYLYKISDVHGANHPELHEVKNEFFDAADALSKHMEDEENILFPVVNEMVQAKKDGQNIEAPCFGMLKNPINQMLDEHKNEGDRFDKLAEKTNNFKVPSDGCKTYEITYKHLRDFITDLHKHIHLENNILFPESIKLEKEVIKR